MFHNSLLAYANNELYSVVIPQTKEHTMLFAIPCRESSLSNHFAKAPQIMLWDSKTDTKRILDLPKSSACCSHKKFWNKVLQDNQVDAVVVRSIGTNMLSALFKLNVRVLSAPRGFDLDILDEKQLTPVTHIEFARPSAKKSREGCSMHSPTSSLSVSMRRSVNSGGTVGRQTLGNKLSPKAMNHLAKVFKLTVQPEKKQ